jgi:DNA-binding NarL/FixJ family response regulator
MKAARQDEAGALALRKKTASARLAGLASGPANANGFRGFNQRAWAAITHSLNLSSREQQLVRGVFEDYTDHSIASALCISPHTVHTHFERLHRKLGVANRAQLILRVVDEFLALTASPGSGLPPLCPNHNGDGCAWHRRRGPA